MDAFELLPLSRLRPQLLRIVTPKRGSAVIRYLWRIDNSLGKKFLIRPVTGLVDAEEADLKISGRKTRAINGILATKQEKKAPESQEAWS